MAAGPFSVLMLLVSSLTGGVLTQGEEPTWKEPFMVSANTNVTVLPTQLTIPEAPVIRNGTTVATVHFSPPGTDVFVHCFLPFLQVVPGTVEGTYFVQTIKDFDYESEERETSCIFQLVADDSDACFNNAKLCKLINVVVENVNDKPPEFSSPMVDIRNLVLRENMDNDSLFLITAVDTEFNSKLSIYIEGHEDHSQEDPPFPFYFTEQKVVVGQAWQLGVSRLNYETARYYNFLIRLKDEPDRFGTSLTSGGESCTVEVEDEGDNRPEWVKICSIKNLNENADIDEPLFTIRAVDADAGIANTIEYHITSVMVEDEDFTDKFDISVGNDTNAVVRAKESLDREDSRIGTNFMFTFTISANEVGDCGQLCTVEEPISCFMRLQDENDNSPSFAKPEYQATILENFAADIDFGNLTVFDIDQYDKGFNRYTISIDEDQFKNQLDINPTSGQGSSQIRIHAKDPSFFDYENEMLRDFKFTLRVTDSNNTALTSTAVLEVKLKDENDNKPIFQMESCEVAFNEDLSDLVTDQSNNHVIDLKIIAKDEDVSSNYSTSSIIYKLLPPLYSGLNIRTITSLETRSPIGELYIEKDKVPFDFEFSETFSVQVAAMDNNGNVPSQVEELTCTLKVNDINDEIPQFSGQNPQEFCVYENSPLIWPAEPGQCLGIDSAIFTASDKDAASDLTIGIDWKESKGYSRDNQRVSNTTLYEDTFVMSQKKRKQSVTGTLEISSEKFIDYESVARLELTLFVEDKGATNQRITTVIQLRISDLDDTKPTFLNPEKMRMKETYEGQSTNGERLRIWIEDTDIDVPIGFDFTIEETGGTPQGMIAFEDADPSNKERWLHIVAPMDRESEDIKELNGLLTYMLTVRDLEKNENVMQITIEVEDINDCAPEFSENNPTFWIPEEAMVGSEIVDFSNGRIVQLNATDNDVDPTFKQITYRLDQQNDPAVPDFFSLEQSKGTFRLKQPLTDYPFSASNDNKIQFKIYATDYNDDHKTSQDITFFIDRNYPPTFKSTVQLLNMTEGETETTYNLTIATDRNNEEHPENWIDNQICYYIMGGDPAGNFEVGLQTNILQVMKAVDRDCGKVCETFTLWIAASNNCDGKPGSITDISEESLLQVRIDVMDVNDETPKFVKSEIFAGVSTEDKNNKVIERLQAVDADSNDTLVIAITDTQTSDSSEGIAGISEPFRLVQDKNDAEIRLNFNPTPTMKGYFELTVTVRDAVQHDSFANIKIVIITPEDNCRFRFSESKDYIEMNQDKLIDVFNKNFPWIFNIDQIMSDEAKESQRAEALTVISSHFLDKSTFEPVSSLMAYGEFDRVLPQLIYDLKANNFTLQDFYIENPTSGTGLPVYVLVLSVMTSLFGLMVAFLLAAYCIRTRNLERKVKALETVATPEPSQKKVDKIFLTSFQENVPGSNEFAEQGANPLFQLAMESADFDDDMKFDDNASQSSGDSILIGVEDQKEFKEYKDRLQDMGKEFSRSGKETSKYRTLDDYHAEDINEPAPEYPGKRAGQNINPLYRGSIHEDEI